MTMLCAFTQDRGPAQRLAQRADVPIRIVDLHRFPDGENMPIVPTGAERVALYHTLARPDAKLLPLLLAADAWRRAGVTRLTLIAPYLCYLRQDAVFRAGEPLSRDVVAKLLTSAFDRIVTVDPHLHRTPDFHALYGASALALSAAPLLAAAFEQDEDGWVVVGPDAESRPWAAGVAAALNAPLIVLAKQRLGDEEVSVSDPDRAAVNGRPVVLVDDICASGGTLEAALRRLTTAGARSVDVAVTHALFGRETERRLRQAGARRIVFTDSCRSTGAAVRLADLLAAALKDDLA